MNANRRLNIATVYFVIVKQFDYHIFFKLAAAVAQWVRAYAPRAEVWVFESQPRQDLSRKKR